MTNFPLHKSHLIQEHEEHVHTHRTQHQYLKTQSIEKRLQSFRFPFLMCLEKETFGETLNQNFKQQSHLMISLAHPQHKLFCKVFKNLSRHQKENILCIVKGQLENQKFEQMNENAPNEQQSFQCEVGRKICKIMSWSASKIIINTKLKKVMVDIQDKLLGISLKEYILRRSKVHQNCFAFESVSIFQSEKIREIRVRFINQNKHNFQKFQDQVNHIIGINIVKAFSKKSKLKTLHQIAISKAKNRLSMFLNQRRIQKLEQFLRQSGMSCKYFFSTPSEVLTQHYSTFPEVSNIQEYVILKKQGGSEIEVGQQDKSLYRIKILVSSQKIENLGNFVYSYINNHKMIAGTKLLQTRNCDQSNFIREMFALNHKFIHNDQIFQQIMVGEQHEDYQIIIPKRKSHLFFSLIDVDHPQNVSFIEHLQMTAKYYSNDELQITVHVKFYKRRQLEGAARISYLQRFRAILQGVSLMTSKCMQAKMIEAEIMKAGRLNQSKNLGYVLSENIQYKTTQNQTKEEQNGKEIGKYLKHHHKLEPEAIKKGIRMTEHFFWKNWRRDENGGLVCADQELVARQKEMAKIVLKKFGEQILKMKNIINFSLPVVVFKKESHLQSIARSQLYAPIFIERAAAIKDPLERMKYSIIIMMTENALSIHMQKPFNPILGQTYQGWVDGCPIYLQQISHHPPVSAYYMVGRGYKKYGSIEPKISFGLNINKASGYSSNPHYVEFNDGMKIEYICAKIVIGGLFIGERTFTFEDKIYAFDRKHRYFASMKFGPVESGFFSSSHQPADYFHGFIYEVISDFEKYFDSLMPKPHPQPIHIVKKLVQFDGIWNSYVNVNKQRVVDFRTDLPYQFQIQNCPIPSDSRYRRDLIDLLRGDLEAAQESKEIMQEQQRRDKKLRQQNQQTKKKALS